MQSKRKRNKRLGEIRLNKLLESRYRKLLAFYVHESNKIIKGSLFQSINKIDSGTVLNEDSHDIKSLFDQIEIKTRLVFSFIKPKLTEVFAKMFLSHKDKFSSAMIKAVGVNLMSIFSKEAEREEFNLAIAQNLSLIKSLSERQLSRIQNIVYQDLRSSEFNAGNLKKQITEEFGVTERHANFIAKDQSHKFYSSLTEIKCKQLNVDKYIWHNAGDRRVRGNPSGFYPNAKHNHWTREGKVFYFSRPPAGGNPGQDYGCRCYAEPILPDEFEEIINGKD